MLMRTERPTKNFRLPTKSRLISGGISCSAIGLLLYLSMLCLKAFDVSASRTRGGLGGCPFARTRSRWMRWSSRRFRFGRCGLRAILTACRAHVLLVVGVLGQTVIERMAHLKAIDADIVDAFDGFVDAFAVEN